jgi:hypothetical protein
VTMEFKTSYDEIMINISEWEIYLENSTKMLMKIRTSDHEAKKYLEERFIGVMFNIKIANEEYVELKNILASKTINFHKLQKHLKYYITNIDGVLDMYERFTKKRNSNIFKRENYGKLNKNINDLRNIDLRERLLPIEYQNNYGGQITNPAYMAGTQKISYVAVLDKDADKPELEGLLDNTYKGAKSILEEHIILSIK